MAKKLLKLSKDYAVWVSEIDFEFLSQWKWSASDCSRPWHLTKKVYGVRGFKTKHPDGSIKYNRVYLHREIMCRILGDECSQMEGKVVDHGDGDTMNNTRENLWLITQAENSSAAGKKLGEYCKGKSIAQRKEQAKHFRRTALAIAEAKKKGKAEDVT